MQLTAITTLFLASATFGLARSSASTCVEPSQPDRHVSAYIPIQSQWGQCGGKNFDGPTKCSSGWSCEKESDYYSQCRKKDQDRDQDTQAFYGQCGGKNYDGPTKCEYPAHCTKKNDYYSQCL